MKFNKNLFLYLIYSSRSKFNKGDDAQKSTQKDNTQPFRNMILPIYQGLTNLNEDIQELTGACEKLLKLKQEKALYVTSSMFLLKCHEYLMLEAPETLHFVTGIQIMNLRIMDILTKIEMNNRSLVHVEGELQSTANELIRMDMFGHFLLGIFYSHPGDGVGSISPSPTDVNTQKRYEKGGYPVVSAVFSKDGYIKFFSHKLDFEISIYGKGVKNYGDKTFQITQL